MSNPVVVSLRDVIEAMDLPSDEWDAFLDPLSGAIIVTTDDDTFDADESPENLAALESGRCLPLPDSFEIHEWSIMQCFCESVEPPETRDSLLNCIRGRGAFQRFKAALVRFDLRDRWFSFRDAEYERHAREWLESNGIPYA